jgi:hypothetical protein
MWWFVGTVVAISLAFAFFKSANRSFLETMAKAKDHPHLDADKGSMIGKQTGNYLSHFVYFLSLSVAGLVMAVRGLQSLM